MKITIEPDKFNMPKPNEIPVDTLDKFLAILETIKFVLALEKVKRIRIE